MLKSVLLFARQLFDVDIKSTFSEMNITFFHSKCDKWHSKKYEEQAESSEPHWDRAVWLCFLTPLVTDIR